MRELLAHLDNAALEVDRAPAQAGELAEAQPRRGERADEEGGFGIGDLEERRDLRGREGADLVLVTRPVHILERVGRGPAEAPRMLEDRAEVDQRTPLGILKQLGLPARTCPTNDLLLRLEAIRRPLTRLSDGEPSFQVFARCTKLRKALSGGYHYRRVHVGGGERFHDLPEKDDHSHVVDALGYALLGGGEGKPRLPIGYRRHEYAIT